jgi:hypothetical protein
VTISAVNAVVEYVMEVAELDGLLDVLVRAGDVRRAADEHGAQDQTRNQHERAGKTELGNGIGAAMEDLRHFLWRN